MITNNRQLIELYIKQLKELYYNDKLRRAFIKGMLYRFRHEIEKLKCTVFVGKLVLIGWLVLWLVK